MNINKLISKKSKSSGLKYVPEKYLKTPTNGISEELKRAINSPARDNSVSHDETISNISMDLAKKNNIRIENIKIKEVNCYKVIPKNLKDKNKLIIGVHGGGYINYSGIASTLESILLAATLGYEILCIDYKQLPEYPYPHGLNDLLIVWKEIIKDRNPKSIAMAGSSAGAALIMALMHKIKEFDLIKPAVLFLGSPAADLSRDTDSVQVNEWVDNVLVSYDEYMGIIAKKYANGGNIKDIGISPYYGNLKDFPPSILATGTRDMLLSATVKTHRKLRQNNVDAQLHVFEAMSHCQYLANPNIPEGEELRKEIKIFFDKYLL